MRAGLLERDDEHRVRLGMRLWELALRGSSALRLRQAALPFMTTRAGPRARAHATRGPRTGRGPVRRAALASRGGCQHHPDRGAVASACLVVRARVARLTGPTSCSRACARRSARCGLARDDHGPGRAGACARRHPARRLRRCARVDRERVDRHRRADPGCPWHRHRGPVDGPPPRRAHRRPARRAPPRRLRHLRGPRRRPASASPPRRDFSHVTSASKAWTSELTCRQWECAVRWSGHGGRAGC